MESTQMPDDVTIQRLEDQIRWYDTKSAHNQKMFKRLKLAMVAIAGLIPFMAGVGAPGWSTAAMGIVIVVLEATQQLNQYQAHWIAYRSTAEALKHEKYLYGATAGPYASAENPHALLAERIEGTVSQEHAKWISAHEETGRRREAQN
jgi:hypothetical protein